MGYTFDGRMAVLGPHVHEGVPLVQAASAAGVPLRTAQRWIAAYLTQGATGLRRAGRADRDRHRLPDELLKVIEGMALRRPPPHAAEVYPSSGQDRRRAGAGSRRRTPSSGRSSPVWTAGCWPWRTMTGRCTGTPTSWCCAGNPGIRTICGRPITPNWM